MDLSRRNEIYEPALSGKRIPVLTLDNKWHKLFTQTESNAVIEALADELNSLLKRQGKLNTEQKDIRRLKKRLMGEIVNRMDENGQTDQGTDKKMADNKRLINECNEKIEAYQDELMDLPSRIDEVNYRLMLATMDVCYERIRDNTREIDEIAEWISQIRVELKKNVIRKQEREDMNHALYSYMHDIFGAEVIEIFDMKYDPGEKKSKKKSGT